MKNIRGKLYMHYMYIYIYIIYQFSGFSLKELLGRIRKQVSDIVGQFILGVLAGEFFAVFALVVH